MFTTVGESGTFYDDYATATADYMAYDLDDEAGRFFFGNSFSILGVTFNKTILTSIGSTVSVAYGVGIVLAISFGIAAVIGT